VHFRRNSYLDPSQTWLEFTFTVTATGTPQLDGSANSLIKKIEVYSSAGSNLLESIDQYGVLFQACSNVVNDVDDMSSASSVCEGYDAPYGAAFTVGTNLVSSYANRSTRAREVNGTVLTAGTYTFALPLMCMVGTLGDKYIPLHALAADLRVEITWQTWIAAVNTAISTFSGDSGSAAAAAVISGSNSIGTIVPAYQTGAITALSAFTGSVGNVFLNCGIVQISDDAQAAIDAMTGGIYTWHGESW
jgi:hypothetical protein